MRAAPRSLALASALSLLLLLIFVPAWADDAPDKEIEGARAVLSTYAKLVNERRLDALATVFVKDVDYRSESWIHVQGVKDITAALRKAVQEKPGMRIDLKAGTARRIAPSVVQVDGRYTLWDGPDAVPSEGGLTVTCVNGDGAWKITTLRDWADEPTPREVLFTRLDWLMGTWQGTSMDVPFRLKAALTPGGGFLHLAMEFGGKDDVPVGISTLIGLDASTGAVRSWHFMHDGGMGEGTWAVGDHVLEGSVRFVSGDGKVVESVRRLALRDDGSLVIETKERHVGDRALPAGKPIVMTRVNSEAAGS